MKPAPRTKSLLLLFAPALAGLAVFFFLRIFGNVCVDGDTLNYVSELARAEKPLTLRGSVACMGWFSKFHLILFPLLYISTRAYSLLGGWDLLMGFKLLTYVCTLGTFCLLFILCSSSVRRTWIAVVAAVVPLLTLGPCWMATTCDDNAVAAFFEVLFVVAVIWCCRRMAKGGKGSTAWAFGSGIAAGLNLGAHLKSIVSLPVLASPVLVKGADNRRRFRVAAAALGGLMVSFGGLYLLYLLVSSAQPAQARTDFMVFHRQPGRFFFTRYESGIGDWLYFIYVGIRSTLFAFQELYVNTNLFDRDLLGPALLVLFFGLYAVAVFATRRRLATRVLFFYFLCHMVHSSLYDSWVSERWDSIVVPVVVTVAIFWDSVLHAERRRGGVAAATAAVLLLFGGLVTANFVQTERLMAITANRRSYAPSAYRWPYPKKAFFFFNHRDYYRLAGELDSHFDDTTGFIPLRYTQPSRSHAVGYLDQYLSLYSKGYKTRQVDNIMDIETLAGQGKLTRILYLDRLEVPFYHEGRRKGVVFNEAATRTLFEGSQLTLKEVTLAVEPKP